VADLVTAAEAAQRLGVKQATLYAYVSRGVLLRRVAGMGDGADEAVCAVALVPL